MQQPSALSITDLNSLLKELIETSHIFNDIWITGEISQFSHYAKANHYYFHLTDGKASINCVMYSTFIRLVAFKPKVGQRIFARGKLQFFKNKGSVIFQTVYITLDGIGDQIKQFEILKKLLDSQGYFDPSNKKPLPKYPETIALITAPDSAAFGDFISTLRLHNHYSTVNLIPTIMQGPQSSLSIIESIDISLSAQVDIIAIVRGGGSVQDLSGYNDENLCHKAFNCTTPIITGIGHQTDTSLIDLIADISCVTPTACADYLSTPFASLKTMIEHILSAATLHYEKETLQLIQYVQKTLLVTSNIVEKAILDHEYFIEKKCETLLSYNPLDRLKQGYSITSKGSKSITSVKNLSKNDIITTDLYDGKIISTVKDTYFGKKTNY